MTSKTISEVITTLQAQIGELEDKIFPLKQKVNFLCEIEEIALLYPDATDSAPGSHISPGMRLKPDEFTGDKLNKAMRKYLELRKQYIPDHAPATIDDIHSSLIEGGFDFRGKDSLQAVSISLGKSSHTFKRLNNGLFGLASWYGIKPNKLKANNTSDTQTEDDIDDDVDDDIDDRPEEQGSANSTTEDNQQ